MLKSVCYHLVHPPSHSHPDISHRVHLLPFPPFYHLCLSSPAHIFISLQFSHSEMEIEWEGLGCRIRWRFSKWTKIKSNSPPPPQKTPTSLPTTFSNCSPPNSPCPSSAGLTCTSPECQKRKHSRRAKREAPYTNHLYSLTAEIGTTILLFLKPTLTSYCNGEGGYQVRWCPGEWGMSPFKPLEGFLGNSPSHYPRNYEVHFFFTFLFKCGNKIR